MLDVTYIVTKYLNPCSHSINIPWCEFHVTFLPNTCWNIRRHRFLIRLGNYIFCLFLPVSL